MPQYLIANYLPDDFDPSAVTEEMIEEIHALNREMIAAGVRKFACGISPARNAKTVRKQPDGKVLVTDGPYTETKEHMGGFWILEAADMDEALAWARKGAISCDAEVSLRKPPGCLKQELRLLKWTQRADKQNPWTRIAFTLVGRSKILRINTCGNDVAINSVLTL